MLKKGITVLLSISIAIMLTACSVKDTDVVAYVNIDIENPESMTITYEEFNLEYQLFLYTQGIDESDPDQAYDAMVLRNDVINYQVSERIYLRAAEDLGIGISSFTQEDYEQVNIKVTDLIEEIRESYRSEALSAFSKEPTDEQLNARMDMLYERYLRESGMTLELFEYYCTNEYVKDNLLEYIVKDVDVDDQELDDFIKENQEEAEADFEDNPNVYVYDYSNYKIFIPEGTRSVKHILIRLDDDTISEIDEIWEQGDEEEALAARDAALDSIKGKAEDVLKRLDEGEDFDELMNSVSDDKELNASEEGAYRIPPGFTAFGQEFHDAVFELSLGEYSELVPTDIGWSIILFDSYTEYTDEQWQVVREEFRETYIDYKKTALKEELVADWEEQYPYTIEKKKLRINDLDG